MSSIADMKTACIDAIETFDRLPPDRRGSGSAWPEIAREKGTDYASDQSDVRLPPTARAISDAERFTDLVNHALDEDDRKEVWRWGWIKARRDRTVRGYCEKFGLKEHEYRRRIDKLFQILVENRKDFAPKSHFGTVDEVPETRKKAVQSETYFRTDDKFRRRKFLQDLLERTDRRM